jgi:hypothetical protein
VDRDAALQAAALDLSARFPVIPWATVHRLLVRCFAEFEDAPVQSYVPLLVRRMAERRLNELDALPSGPPGLDPTSSPGAPAHGRPRRQVSVPFR